MEMKELDLFFPNVQQMAVSVKGLSGTTAKSPFPVAIVFIIFQQ